MGLAGCATFLDCLGMCSGHQPVLLGASAPTTTQSTSSQLLNEARGFVYRVRSVACLAVGTSFAVDGMIVTNRHVASGSSSLQLATWNGNDFSASVSAIASGADLALLSNAPNASSVTLAPGDPAAGTPVWVTGYPEGNQLSCVVRTDYGLHQRNSLWRARSDNGNQQCHRTGQLGESIYLMHQVKS